MQPHESQNTLLESDKVSSAQSFLTDSWILAETEIWQKNIFAELSQDILHTLHIRVVQKVFFTQFKPGTEFLQSPSKMYPRTSAASCCKDTLKFLLYDDEIRCWRLCKKLEGSTIHV